MKAYKKNAVAVLTHELADDEIEEIDIVTLVGLLYEHRNHFIRIAWDSHQNKTLRKKGSELALQLKNQEVRKLYVCTVRNDFSFANRVRRTMERRGLDAGDWQPQPPTWGVRVDGTPFIYHQNQYHDGVLRLYGFFLPMRYHTIENVTGYYVDGVKGDDDAIEAVKYDRAEPTDELGKARLDSHPVKARIDDMLLVKIGKWYKIKPPTIADVEQIAASAIQFGEEAEAA